MSRGHSPTEVQSFSIKKLLAFQFLSARREQREKLEQMNLTRIAYHADKKGFEKVTRQLKDG